MVEAFLPYASTTKNGPKTQEIGEKCSKILKKIFFYLMLLLRKIKRRMFLDTPKVSRRHRHRQHFRVRVIHIGGEIHFVLVCGCMCRLPQWSKKTMGFFYNFFPHSAGSSLGSALNWKKC